MNVASAVIGLSGLIAVFDKACEVWQVIRAAKDFGDDVAHSIRILEVEFFRFQSWWTVVYKLDVSPARSGGDMSYSEMPFLATYLSNPSQNPIVSIAHSILGILQDVEGLLRSSGALAVLDSQIATTSSLENSGHALPKQFGDQINDAKSATEGLSRHLLSAVPWRKRVKHDATPWRRSNKVLLDDKLRKFRDWNNTLYSILPHELRNSILRQGMSGHLLANPEEASFLAELDQGAVSQQAKLLQIHRKLAENTSMSSSVTGAARDRLISFNLSEVQVYDGELFSIVRQSNGQQAYLIEWYQIPETREGGVELRSIARERLANLSILLSSENKPSTLCAADSVGYVETDQFYRFGLASRIPEGASSDKLPVTLHSLLCRKPFSGTSSRTPLPSLNQRFSLASSLATSLYTFMLARWHHKLFNSLNIYFMFYESESRLPNLNSPLVGGYSVSRPSAIGEISICATESSLSDSYLHPQLRVPAQERPKYAIKYEIYSLGLLLAEIGFWQPIFKVAAASSPRHGLHSAEGLRNAIIEKTSTDLACWMGEQYKDITLRCLRIGEGLGERIGDDLSEFYWRVVLELVQFAERVKVLRYP